MDEIQNLLKTEKLYEDQIPQEERERLRWDEYHRLDCAAMAGMTRFVSEKEYDDIAADQWGRQWSSTIRENKNRDRGSIGKDVLPRLLQPEEPDVFLVAETEDQPHEEEQESKCMIPEMVSD
jgi:hypothetical protein